MPRLPIAVLISGSGRTLKNFIDLAAADELPVDIRLVISSSGKAGGLKFAEEAGIETMVVRRSTFDTADAFGEAIFRRCRATGIEYVVMAGFLKLLPIPADFKNRVLNIHPALLPDFGGGGMYGHRVHQAVLASNATESGCTVHFADNEYDHGPIAYQRRVPVLDGDTPETLADRVFEVEKEVYPLVLRLLAAGELDTIESGP